MIEEILHIILCIEVCLLVHHWFNEWLGGR